MDRISVAGGMGGFFGHFSERFNQYGPFRPNGPCGYHPDSLKRAFCTFRELWKRGRLKLSMSPDNSRIGGAKGYCLVTADKKHFLFFVEDADSMTIDLCGMPGSQPIVLADAKARYHEIDKGRLTAGARSILTGSTSDLALAIGEFSARISRREGPDTADQKQALKQNLDRQEIGASLGLSCRMGRP